MVEDVNVSAQDGGSGVPFGLVGQLEPQQQNLLSVPGLGPHSEIRNALYTQAWVLSFWEGENPEAEALVTPHDAPSIRAASSVMPSALSTSPCLEASHVPPTQLQAVLQPNPRGA